METTGDQKVTRPLPQTPTVRLEDFADPDLTLDEALELLIHWAGTEIGSEDVIHACEDFANNTGKVFHDDDFYDSRMHYFLDHYLFEREVEGKTPYHHLGALLPDDRLPESTKSLIRDMASHTHSLFMVLKVSEDQLVVRDVITREKHTIHRQQGELFHGYQKKDLFQGFLVPWRGKLHLSRGIILHPSRAGKVILSQLKKAKKDHAFSLSCQLAILAKKQLRYLRHRHVDPRTIYLHDPR